MMTMEQRQRRVLVADDSVELREGVAAVLRSVGFDVSVACDGRELLAAFEGEAAWPDVVLTDVQMPRIDGVEALHRLRSSGVETPFVFITGLEGEALVSLKRRLGGWDELVLKPFYISEVLAAVGRAAHGRGPRVADSPGREA